MFDRPALEELLAAVHFHLNERLLPAVESNTGLADETRIAAEVISVALRQLNAGVEPLRAAWNRLNFVQNVNTPFPADPVEAEQALRERERKLCESVNAGYYDLPARRAALFEHLLVTARAQIEVANPAFLEALAQEDQRADHA